MTNNEKSIISLLLAVTEKIYGLSETQFLMARVLSKLPIVDEKLQENLRDAVARCEAQQDQNQALLADVQALSKLL